jgi:SAM-dependent methyltransferase
LAPVYDYLLKHVDYAKWYNFISSVMYKYISQPGLVLELGCGTGKFGAKFSSNNIHIIGMDKSVEMLKIAKMRTFKKFSIFCGDVTQFSLSIKPDFIFSVHDTLNYLLTYEEILSAFKSIKNIMHKDSIFLFDITTEYNITHNFADKTTFYKKNKTNIEWTNKFDKKNKFVYSRLKFSDKNRGDRVEEHIQRIYSIEEIKGLLKKVNFELLEIIGDYTFLPPTNKTVMTNFIVRV